MIGDIPETQKKKKVRQKRKTWTKEKSKPGQKESDLEQSFLLITSDQ
jgi:hypothetical protein